MTTCAVIAMGRDTKTEDLTDNEKCYISAASVAEAYSYMLILAGRPRAEAMLNKFCITGTSL